MLAYLLPFADPVPEDKDVVAGGWGALIFVFLIVVGIFLFVSLSKQLRKAHAAEEAGVYSPAKQAEIDTANQVRADEDGDEL